MELLLTIVGLGVFGALALRFGHDSRPPADSKEEHLADLGMNWGLHSSDLADLRREAAMWRGAQSRRRRGEANWLRRRLARTLLTVADWLSPELANAEA
jgi:hypothetical protein